MTRPDRPTATDGAIVGAGVVALSATIGTAIGAHPIATIWMGFILAALGASAFERLLERDPDRGTTRDD